MEALAAFTKGSPAGLKLISSLENLADTSEAKDQLAQNILAFVKHQGPHVPPSTPEASKLGFV